MGRVSVFVTLGVLALCLGQTGVAQSKRGASSGVLKRALSKSAPLGAGQHRVSHRLGAVGADRYLAIGVHVRRGSDCGDHDGVAYPCRWITPFLVVATRAGGLVAFQTLATTKDAHTEFKWGFAKLKDVDGDGRRELSVIFGYVHHPVTVYEREFRREIVWVDFKSPQKPRRQGGLLLGHALGDEPVTKTTFRYVRTATGHFDIDVKRRTFGQYEDVVSKARHRYAAAADAWTPETKPSSP